MIDVMGYFALTVYCRAQGPHERCDGWHCTCWCHVPARYPYPSVREHCVSEGMGT